MMEDNVKIYIYPTDTVWGIGAPIKSESLHRRIAEIKRTRADKPLSILYTSLKDLLFDFELPMDSERNEKWWRSFFQLETTLALKIENARRPVPKWITHKSDIVCLRLNESDDLQAMSVEGAISTTSLNIHGAQPIKTLKEALHFQEQYAPEAQLIQPVQLKPSGQASSIVIVEKDMSFKFMREGARINEVKKFLGLSST